MSLPLKNLMNYGRRLSRLKDTYLEIISKKLGLTMILALTSFTLSFYTSILKKN